ncbi:MAG TPA: tetratricopeptide repeat protein [Verrucomicrobiae bacterium]|nr:tetratricopeptide repeat protein [Verrucomicrobiae bacterium]
MLCLLGRLPSLANDADSSFESANKLYEQGRFIDAAASYQKILQTGRVSAALHFNLGNALFKSGQVGRAILNFRLAQQLAPRDPDIRANLQFARNSVGAGGSRATDRWRRWVHRLTLNEWTAVTVAALWLWFGLLVAGQLRPGFKRALRGYTAIAGATALLLGTGLGLAFYDRFHTLWAVVVTPESVVRYGPLEESQSHYKLRDGAEVIVTDRQNGWLEVVDSAGRKGWLRRDQVVSLRESVDRQSMVGAATR